LTSVESPLTFARIFIGSAIVFSFTPASRDASRRIVRRRDLQPPQPPSVTLISFEVT
jgi:hypothetical protein